MPMPGWAAPTVVLPSKVHVPRPVAGAVERLQVADLLARCVEARLTCIVAPAGFGKSSAAVAAARGFAGHAVAWFTAGPEDASLPAFWTYVLAALAAADPALCPGADDLAVPATFAEFRPLLDALIVRMDAAAMPFVLVVEDLHAVQDDPEVVRSLEYLVRNLPVCGHLVLTSRTEPRLPLVRLRLAGELVEVGEAELAFTPEQVGELFSRMGVPIDAAQRREVWEKTGGWPAGVKMAALLASGPCRGDVGRALSALRPNMHAYLGEEALDGLPEAIVSFMVRTSLVKTFTPELARILTGLSHAQVVAALDEVVARGLFVQRVEDGQGRTWYRYHPLFADLLAERAALLDPDAVASSLAAACAWYRGQGYLDQAVELAARQGDWGTVRDVILDNWKRLYMADAHATLERWGRALPEEELARSPYAAAVLAMPTALAGDLPRAERLLAAARARLHDERDYLFALCEVQRAFLDSFSHDFAAMRVHARAAIEALPTDEAYLHAMMEQVEASSWTASDPGRAYDLLLASAQAHVQGMGRNAAASLWCNLALICADLGRCDEARSYAARAYALYSEEERPLKPMLLHGRLAEAVALYESGDSAGALGVLDGPLGAGAAPGLLIGARLGTLRAKCLAASDPRGARTAFLEAASGDETGALRGLPTLDMARAWCAGRRVDAGLLLDEDRSWEERLFGALVAAATSDAGLCDRACAFAANAGKAGLPVEQRACAAAAVLCAACGFLDRSLGFMERAALIAYADGLEAGLAENATWLRDAAGYAAERSGDPRVRSWLRVFCAAAPAGGEDPAAGLLSERELEVVRLIARGMSLAQAADALVVSRETVKKHLANVYAKLGVHSKTQAVAALRDRGIIG